MRHSMKGVLGAALCVAASICGAPALALDRANGRASLGTCRVDGQVDPGNGYWTAIWVRYGFMGASQATAGSYYYNSDVGVPSRWTTLDATIISSCLGGGAVTNFIPDDTVNGGTLASDAYMGFSFDHAGTHYEYAMVGATGTQWVANTSPADATSPTVSLSSNASPPQSGPFTLTVTFSELVTGFTAGDVTLSNGTLGPLTGSGASYTIGVTPVQMGTPVVISVAAGVAQDAATNPNTAATDLTISTGSPSSAFAAVADQIKQVLLEDTTRNLRSVIASNQMMSREARERFIASQGSSAGGAGDVAFDVEGGVDTTDTVISSKGAFFGQTSLGSGQSRLVFGNFDVQHDSATGSSTATMNGKVAWEAVVSNKITLGYFIGGELARSNITGSFVGNQNRVGLSVGAYAVEEFAENVYLDGFFSLGVGRNNLTMSDAVLELESDYTTRTASLGASLSGVIEQKGFELWPELSVSYGRTWLGDLDFTGQAYGLVDNTLQLDAGKVSLANIMFRPEFRVPLDGLSGTNSLQLVIFAPRLLCEQVKAATTEEHCGGGAEIGFSGSSADGRSSVSAKFMADRIGGSTKSSLQLNLQRQF
jgi:hypothetical protein